MVSNTIEKKTKYVVETIREIGVGLVIGGGLLFATVEKDYDYLISTAVVAVGLTLSLGYTILSSIKEK